MAEPLTLSLISELMPRLYAAFPRTIKGDDRLVLDTYRNGLRGLSGDAVRAAVDRAIQEDTYFPKVARLRELATLWERHNRPAIAATERDVPWNVCPVCGVKAERKKILRKRRDPAKHFAVMRDEHGRELWEEVDSTETYIAHDPQKHHVLQERAE